jgi:hypothetical protein
MAIAVGQRRRPRGARVEREHRGREREQQAGGDHEARDGAAHDPVDDRAPEAALTARLLGGAAEEGDPERVHAVAEQCEDGGKQRQRGDHGDDPDQDRAGGQAAEDRARNEQEPEHREHEGDPAEEDGATGGGARCGDRLELLPLPQPFLPIAGEGEERVVDSEGEAHADQHVLGEDGDVVRLRQQCDEGERHHDRGDRDHDRKEARDDRAEDEQQDDERDRGAEEELALLQILQRRGVLIGVRRPAAGHRRPVARLVIEALNRRYHIVHVVLAVAAERDQEHRRVPVLRDEAPLLAVGDDAGRPGRTQLVRERSDPRARRSRPDLAVLGPHDDDLGDRLTARDISGKALREDPVGLLRLGRPRDLGLALEREEHRHQHEGGDNDDEPQPDHEPRPAAACPRELFGHVAGR